METDAETVIQKTIDSKPDRRELSRRIVNELGAAGFTIMGPQDIAWGICRENTDSDLAAGDPHPHEVSLDLCKWCLQYDPE